MADLLDPSKPLQADTPPSTAPAHEGMLNIQPSAELLSEVEEQAKQAAQNPQKPLWPDQSPVPEK